MSGSRAEFIKLFCDLDQPIEAKAGDSVLDKLQQFVTRQQIDVKEPVDIEHVGPLRWIINQLLYFAETHKHSLQLQEQEFHPYTKRIDFLLKNGFNLQDNYLGSSVESTIERTLSLGRYSGDHAKLKSYPVSNEEAFYTLFITYITLQTYASAMAAAIDSNGWMVRPNRALVSAKNCYDEYVSKKPIPDEIKQRVAQNPPWDGITATMLSYADALLPAHIAQYNKGLRAETRGLHRDFVVKIEAAIESKKINQHSWLGEISDSPYHPAFFDSACYLLESGCDPTVRYQKSFESETTAIDLLKRKIAGAPPSTDKKNFMKVLSYFEACAQATETLSKVVAENKENKEQQEVKTKLGILLKEADKNQDPKLKAILKKHILNVALANDLVSKAQVQQYNATQTRIGNYCDDLFTHIKALQDIAAATRQQEASLKNNQQDGEAKNISRGERLQQAAKKLHDIAVQISWGDYELNTLREQARVALIQAEAAGGHQHLTRTLILNIAACFLGIGILMAAAKLIRCLADPNRRLTLTEVFAGQTATQKQVGRVATQLKRCLGPGTLFVVNPKPTNQVLADDSTQSYSLSDSRSG